MRRVMIILIVLAMIVAVVGRVGLSLLIDRLIETQQQMQAEKGGAIRGISAHFDRIERDESLLTARRQIHDLSITRRGGLQASAELLTVAVPAWDWRRADWKANGVIRLERPGRWVLTAPEANVQTAIALTALAGQPRRVAIQMPELRLDAPMGLGALTARSVTVDFDNDGEMRLAVKAKSVEADEQGELPLVENPELLLHAAPSLPIQPDHASMEAWRAAGGFLDLTAMRLAIGPSVVDMQGRFGLDEALQPVGTGQIRLSGFAALIELLIENSIIPQEAATAARISTGLMAVADQDNDPTVLTLPMRIENGQVFAGEFLIARIPNLMWRP